MPTAESAVIQVEQGAALVPFEKMSDSGDGQIFTGSELVWSGRSGLAPVVRPNGIVTGRNLVSPHADDDKVMVAAFSAYSKGVLRTVASEAVTITRPATDVAKVISITMTDAGVLAAVAGTDSLSAAFSETRDAAGGPPEIPADSVEIAQVRVTSSTAEGIAATEIFQVIGQHSERFDFPLWDEDTIGKGLSAAVAAQTNAHIRFNSVLPGSHVDGATKGVYIQYYAPIFGELSRAFDFVPAENSHSVSTTQFYGGTSAGRSTSLGQGSFTALLNDGITDSLVADKDQVLTVKFFPDKNRAPYSLTQGTIGIGRRFPVSDQIQASVTVTAEKATAQFGG
jgi:hypothetical protein